MVQKAQLSRRGLDRSPGSVGQLEAVRQRPLVPAPVHAGQGQQQDEAGPVPGAAHRSLPQPSLHVRHPGTAKLSAQGSGIKRTVAHNVLEHSVVCCYLYAPKISILPGIT